MHPNCAGFRYGPLCIFLCVGAEVSIGSLIVIYMMQDHVMALPEQSAGKLMGLCWGGGAIGPLATGAIADAAGDNVGVALVGPALAMRPLRTLGSLPASSPSIFTN